MTPNIETSTDRNTVRWGIIGCGNVCEVKSGPALYKTPHSRLLAVMRRDGAKAADFARRHGVARSTDDAESILADPRIDIVYVATPPATHLGYALRVAAAGKHCYVEKPMARSAVEGRQMVDAFAAAGRKLFVGYYRRTLPIFAKASALVESGAIGRLTGILHRQYNASHRRPNGWRVDAEQSGGGLFVDLASHVFDALDHLTGPFTRVHGSAAHLAADYAVEDVVSVCWQSERGAVGTSLWNFASDVEEEGIDLTGTEGRLSWPVFGGSTITLTRGKRTETFDAPYPEHVHGPLVQTIVDELRGVGVCPSTGESALRTQIVLDACLNDYYRGRDDAFWARPQTWRRQET
ncbi:MAG TPA: Gfo/Idh/MocA family oxidoreductase [Tepidisphaeraceae bacterium]|jgi:predicted dehydrogenase